MVIFENIWTNLEGLRVYLELCFDVERVYLKLEQRAGFFLDKSHKWGGVFME